MQLQISAGYDFPACGTTGGRHLLSMLASLPVPASVRCVAAAMVNVWSSVQALKEPGQGHKQVCRSPWVPVRLCCRLG